MINKIKYNSKSLFKHNYVVVCVAIVTTIFKQIEMKKQIQELNWKILFDMKKIKVSFINNKDQDEQVELSIPVHIIVVH